MAHLSEVPASILVIRHARAGNPERWHGDDRQRPLTRSGRRQAEALSALFQHDHFERILSSPYQRCLETVAPLAGRLGITVERVAALAVGAGAASVMTMLSSVPDSTVLCSHGDVIFALLEDLAAQGLLPASAVRCEKGATWVLERVAGRLISARYMPAPPFSAGGYFTVGDRD